jgi:hypothetical protein
MMGAWKPGFASCSNNAEAPAPNPKNFEILKQVHRPQGQVLIVKYPDCTNYEGVKVLVYKTSKFLGNMSELDPHFDKGGKSPFARFEPTPAGIAAAIKLAEMFI